MPRGGARLSPPTRRHQLVRRAHIVSSGFNIEALRSAWETGGLQEFLIEDARQMAPTQHILAATRYADAGAVDAAFEEIFASLDEREALVIGLRPEPSFVPLHDDPRWEEALRRLDGLGEAPGE